MLVITIVRWVYEPTYNVWGPHIACKMNRTKLPRPHEVAVKLLSIGGFVPDVAAVEITIWKMSHVGTRTYLLVN